MWPNWTRKIFLCLFFARSVPYFFKKSCKNLCWYLIENTSYLVWLKNVYLLKVLPAQTLFFWWSLQFLLIFCIKLLNHCTKVLWTSVCRRFSLTRNQCVLNWVGKWPKYLFLRTISLAFFSDFMYEDRNINASRPNPRRRGKIKLNFYFHASLWCLKAFYEGPKGLKFLFQYSFQKHTGPEGYDKILVVKFMQKNYLQGFSATGSKNSMFNWV